MESDIWVVRLSDYRKWVVHIYVELYKGNDPYRTVYYDYFKSKWCYAKNEPNKNGVDFNELEKFLQPILIDKYVRDSVSIRIAQKNIDSMKFVEIVEYVSGSLYFDHPEYKSVYNLNNERHRESIKLAKEHSRKWTLSYYKIE